MKTREDQESVPVSMGRRPYPAVRPQAEDSSLERHTRCLVKRGHPPHSVTAARTLPAHGEDNTLLRDETAARTERGNAGSTAHRSCHTQAPSPQRFSSPESLFSGSQCLCKPVLISLHPTLRNQEKSHGTKVMTGTVARSLSTGIAKLNQRQ